MGTLRRCLELQSRACPLPFIHFSHMHHIDHINQIEAGRCHTWESKHSIHVAEVCYEIYISSKKRLLHVYCAKKKLYCTYDLKETKAEKVH